MPKYLDNPQFSFPRLLAIGNSALCITSQYPILTNPSSKSESKKKRMVISGAIDDALCLNQTEIHLI